MRKFRLFTDRSFLPPRTGHLDLLYPYWGLVDQPDIWKPLGVYDEYCRIGKDFFEITENPAQADFALLPNDWKRYVRSDEVELAKRFVKLAKSRGFQTIIFYHSDSDEKLLLDNVIIFRTSLLKSKKRANEHAMPGWNGDLLQYFNNGRVLPSPCGRIPVVGFCGAARMGRVRLQKRLKNFYYKWFDYSKYRFDAGTFRKRILVGLQRSDRVKSNFLLRPGYLGDFRRQGFDPAHMESIRREYFENSVQSDYVLCMRVVGNFSYRFYETLSLGRIPIFVNTDCVLPLDSILNYKDLVVWIELDEIDRIDQKVLDHFNKIGKDGLIDLQVRLREIWKEFLSPEGFFRNIHKVLQTNPHGTHEIISN